MPERFPGYDVLSKRTTPSWNEATRRVIDARLAMVDEPHFFHADEWQTLKAICQRIVPQPANRPPVPIAAMVDHKMEVNHTDGYRRASMPTMREAWRRGLAALDATATNRHGKRFHMIDVADQNKLLKAMQQGELDGPEWNDLPAHTFFSQRLAKDILEAYYAHPTAWNEIGFGGPASPRGYVRMNFNMRDPWEAAEASPGHEDAARKANLHVG
ncbi:MAG TPA: gluconate 2-dehydrogenase subunit 3 family protein [Rhodanobacteraceae bacterium]|nr:gluconate 2-dehydrogenase subunit 3 family protein [Rhodanobacteraceae bacterium]